MELDGELGMAKKLRCIQAIGCPDLNFQACLNSSNKGRLYSCRVNRWLAKMEGEADPRLLHKGGCESHSKNSPP